jgi:triacylglycerol lipase
MALVWLVALLAAALVAALLAVAAGAAIRHWRPELAARLSRRFRRGSARRALRRAPRPPPVVLAHGILGFDELGLGPARVSYFRGIVERLQANGAEVHCARVPPLAPIHVRAARLAEMVRALDAPRVNLVAHSMGGLDARYAISRLGLGERVASLITIGTPHRGTPIADLGAELLRRLRLDQALGPIIDVRALHDLTTSRMLAFNREVRDVPGVRYLSVVARAPRGAVHPLLLLAHRWLHRYGENDGLVPARSQRWGQVLREIEADHWSQIGWSGGFDARSLYDEILQELRALGP